MDAVLHLYYDILPLGDITDDEGATAGEQGVSNITPAVDAATPTKAAEYGRTLSHSLLPATVLLCCTAFMIHSAAPSSHRARQGPLC